MIPPGRKRAAACLFAVVVIVIIASVTFVVLRTKRSARNICLTNQEQIYGAVVARALDGNYYLGDSIPSSEILPLIGGRLPECPCDGRYTIPAVGEHPVCSIHGDLLLHSGKLAGPGGMDSALRKRSARRSKGPD